MDTKELATRKAALTRLAVATRERLPDAREDRDALFRVYLDDTEQFTTDTFVLACRRLETSLDWFPKKHELVDACQAVAQYKRDQRKPVLALASGDTPVDPEKLANIREMVKAAVRRKAMR